MSTKTNIYFADLSHTGTIVSANFFPLAIGYVAANLNAEIPGQFEIELFKYPDDLSSALSRQVPRIMGFSNYSWNINLSYEYVKQIKRQLLMHNYTESLTMLNTFFNFLLLLKSF